MVYDFEAEISELCEQCVLSSHSSHPHSTLLSSQLSFLSSQFPVRSSQFGVLSSRCCIKSQAIVFNKMPVLRGKLSQRDAFSIFYSLSSIFCGLYVGRGMARGVA